MRSEGDHGERVLVTGGAGMIGSNLVKRLSERDVRVIVADDLSRGRLEYLEGEDGVSCIDLERDFHHLDLSLPGVIDPLLAEVDLVVHLADVVGGIEYVFQHQGAIFRQNLLINSNVIASVRSQPVQGFVYVGTACSFPAHLQSGVDARPLREEDLYPAAPESSYGWSKLMGQYETELLERECGVPVSIVMFHNVYGTPTDFHVRTAQVIPSLVRKAIRYPEEPFVVLGSGAQGRAFVHVDDAVNGLLAAMDRGLGRGVVQIGPDVCTSIRELAELVAEISGKDIPIEYDEAAPEGDRGRCADYRKANDVLGWSPSVSLRDGIGSLYEWIEHGLLERPAEALA